LNHTLDQDVGSKWVVRFFEIHPASGSSLGSGQWQEM